MGCEQLSQQGDQRDARPGVRVSHIDSRLTRRECVGDPVQVGRAGQTVEVPKGGYYDRYRSNPNLDEVAQDPAVDNIDWFRRIPKVQVDSRVGPLWAPNFYYRASIVQANLLAARHLYKTVGFRCVAQESHHRFAKDLVAETWELAL